ncbi:MAG: hypothetical protein ACJ735_14235 [Actinomycetes bacterium]
MRRRPLRAAAAIALLSCVVSASLSASASAANPVVSGTCVDGNYFDGLNSEYAASYCKSALAAAGYHAYLRRNAPASNVLADQPTDAIFYHSGHALVAGPGPTAVASLMAPNGPSAKTWSGLLGTPTGAYIQGPVTICNDSKHCSNVVLTLYPYETQMQKFKLALFQSCNSAQESSLYPSLVTVAFRAGNVGTAIGFRDAVAYIINAPGDNIAGDAFARRFWYDANRGHTFATSVVDASNAAGGRTYGYSSYVIKHHPKAGTTLRPAGYYAG